MGGGESRGSNMNINENGIDGRVCKVMCTMPIATILATGKDYTLTLLSTGECDIITVKTACHIDKPTVGAVSQEDITWGTSDIGEPDTTCTLAIPALLNTMMIIQIIMLLKFEKFKTFNNILYIPPCFYLLDKVFRSIYIYGSCIPHFSILYRDGVVNIRCATLYTHPRLSTSPYLSALK